MIIFKGQRPTMIFADDAVSSELLPINDNDYKLGYSQITVATEYKPVLENENWINNKVDKNLFYLLENGCTLSYVNGSNYKKGSIVRDNNGTLYRALTDTNTTLSNTANWERLYNSNSELISWSNTQQAQATNINYGSVRLDIDTLTNTNNVPVSKLVTTTINNLRNELESFGGFGIYNPNVLYKTGAIVYSSHGNKHLFLCVKDETTDSKGEGNFIELYTKKDEIISILPKATKTVNGIVKVEDSNINNHSTDADPVVPTIDLLRTQFENLKQGLIQATTPIGAIVLGLEDNPYFAQQGFLRCNGSTFDRNTYPELYKILGNTNQTPNLDQDRYADVGSVMLRIDDYDPKPRDYVYPLTLGDKTESVFHLGFGLLPMHKMNFLQYVGDIGKAWVIQFAKYALNGNQHKYRYMRGQYAPANTDDQSNITNYSFSWPLLNDCYLKLGGISGRRMGSFQDWAMPPITGGFWGDDRVVMSDLYNFQPNNVFYGSNSDRLNFWTGCVNDNQGAKIYFDSSRAFAPIHKDTQVQVQNKNLAPYLVTQPRIPFGWCYWIKATYGALGEVNVETRVVNPTEITALQQQISDLTERLARLEAK